MIQRDPKYYVTGYNGQDPSLAPFYQRALFFDGEKGELNAELIRGFNNQLVARGIYEHQSLVILSNDEEIRIPARVAVINASFDNLPTAYETRRIFYDYLMERGYDIPVEVVNTLEELMSTCARDPENTLVVSQCVDREVYNVKICRSLESTGVVVVPGQITAPGSIFSDKDSTYQMLSKGGKNWEKVARYIKVDIEGIEVPVVVDGILEAVDMLHETTGENVFFVKPDEGGGGLGGFRITRTLHGYLIPDLSKVSGDIRDIQPSYIDLDLEDHDKIMEAVWIYRLFAQDKEMSANYLRVNLRLDDLSDEKAVKVMREYLKISSGRRADRLASMVLEKAAAREKLISAIIAFQIKFKKPYTPLVNEHLDFGLWGLRAHYRLTHEGPRLEGLYHRVFQLSFTPEGLGYLGADNISNKQTGALEIQRLGPVNEIMLKAIGGKDSLFETIEKGADALISLSQLLPGRELRRVPLRAQLDLAAPAKRIGEGNADTARGLCLASRWTDFVENTREWMWDCLKYYTWKKLIDDKG